MINQSVHTFDTDNIWDLILPRSLVWTKCFENLAYTHSGVKSYAFKGRGVFLIYQDTGGGWRGSEEIFG
jgi:hypothetical protein